MGGTTAANKDKRFSVVIDGDIVRLKTWGELNLEDLDAPVNAALKQAQTHHIVKLLDDIREVDDTGTSIYIQAKAMGILWKLRTFDKVAILMQSSTLSTMFFSTLQALHLNGDSRFMGFENEAEALAWLHES
ncbi:MAG TPA: STAS/SEC14 domain-containing protein [Candidatus Saccharimonadales bacterium]|nr:STAS/SEC14 domain-containing protein [Candidatus Saccharimonadales bacterium]